MFPLLHGPMGEDGTIQGLMTLAGIPFVGSGVLGSAVSMDKVMTKQVLAAVGIPQVAWQLALRRDWQQNPQGVKDEAVKLGFPFFVKPANLGSSVGISKVHNEGEMDRAFELAFSLDRRVIVEAMTSHKPREVEVGILGNDAPIASPVGELSFDADFYDYETKYTEGVAQMHIPARIPGEVAENIRELALKIRDFLVPYFEQRGVNLIDFKLEFGKLPNGEIVLADEISPDTCRFWDAQTNEKMDKDRFRRDLGGIEEAYAEMLKRVTSEV